MKKLEQRVPNLRFKGFTDYWEQHKLGDIAKVTKLAGFEFTKYINYSSKGKILAIRGLNIKDGKFNLQDVKYIDNSDFNKLTRSKLRQDDILFTYVGTIGNSAIVPAGVKWYLAPNVCLIRTQTENAKFISHLIQSDKFQHQEIPKWITTSSQPALSMENIRKFSIILPTISEQLKISNLVSIIDTLITLQQRKLDLLKQFKKGFLQKMFADKDSKRPVLRFKGFHDDWEQRKVSDIFTVTRGQVLATTKISEVKTNEMCFPVYSSQTKNNGLMGYYNRYLFNTAITWTTDGANAGTVNYREGKFYSTNVNGVLLSDDGYANKAIAEILDRVAWRHVSRVGNPKLMNNVMSNIKISIPSSFEEQNAISEFLIKFDHLIALHQRKQNHHKLLKKSLLQQMFI